MHRPVTHPGIARDISHLQHSRSTNHSQWGKKHCQQAISPRRLLPAHWRHPFRPMQELYCPGQLQ
ncbi:MAG TPA: hypothetical protein VGF67_00430 [Ktedonobacteraceae bacterium]